MLHNGSVLDILSFQPKENNMKPTPVYTHSKVLGQAACQGEVVLLESERLDSEKVITIFNLVDLGYLETGEVRKGEITYVLTEAGRDYRKKLIGKQPKHTADPEVQQKNLDLEAILTKRLNILRSANKRGLDFNLTDANIKTLLNKKVCYYTNVEFNSNDDPMNAMTFERINDSEGYVKDNVVAVTLRANKIKNLLLEQDGELKINITQFIQMAEVLQKHLIERLLK